MFEAYGPCYLCCSYSTLPLEHNKWAWFCLNKTSVTKMSNWRILLAPHIVNHCHYRSLWFYGFAIFEWSSFEMNSRINTGISFCSGNMMKVLRGHQNWVYSCVFSPDSSMLCSVGANKAVCVKVLVHSLWSGL